MRIAPSWKKDDVSLYFTNLCGKPPSANPGPGPSNNYLWWSQNHESLRSTWLSLYGNGVARLAVDWGGRGRIPVRRLGNSWWVSAMGSECFQSFIFWKCRKLISRLLFTSYVYSFHCTHSMPDTVLRSGSIMLTKTDMVPALMDLRKRLPRQLVHLIRWLFNGSGERWEEGEVCRLRWKHQAWKYNSFGESQG